MKPKNPIAFLPIQPTLRLFVVDKPLADPWNVSIVENALLCREFVSWADLPELIVGRVGLHVDGLG